MSLWDQFRSQGGGNNRGNNNNNNKKKKRKKNGGGGDDTTVDTDGCGGACGNNEKCRGGVCVPRGKDDPPEEEPPTEEDDTTEEEDGGGGDGGGYDADGDGESDIFQKWANATDREAAYRLHLADRLGIDVSGADSDYNDWISDRFNHYDMLYRQAIGQTYQGWRGSDPANPQDGADSYSVEDDGNGGRKRKRRRRNRDGSTTEVEVDENGNPVGEETVVDAPVNPDYWQFLADRVKADELSTTGDPYQDFWANRNQQTHYLNQLQQRGYDTGGQGTQNEYQQWLTGEAFRPYEQGFQQARQSDPNLQFRAYLGNQLGGADLGVEGDTYQDYWGDRNQAAKFTNWARSQGLGQIDNAHNPFTAYVQGEGGMGKLQRAWNQDTGGSTWNDFLKTQDPSKFANDFLRAGRSKQGKAGNAFGSGPGRWSTFG